MATKTDAPTFYDDVDNLKKLCNFLLTGEGPRVREALLMEKRVLYLKGRYFPMCNPMCNPTTGQNRNCARIYQND